MGKLQIKVDALPGFCQVRVAMLLPADNPTLHLSAGLTLLAPALRDFLIVTLVARHGTHWWERCLEEQLEVVRKKYRTESLVRGNSDPSFWLKVADACGETGEVRFGPTELSAVVSLRQYRNLLSHDSAQLAAGDVHAALMAVRTVMAKVAPASVFRVEELLLGLRIQHPAAGLLP